MFQFLLRLAKRLVVLVPGLLIAYLSIKDIFPYFDRRLPVAVAVLVTYIIGAYVLVPALIRGYRIVRPPKHLPLYCVTPDGFASDPLNIGIIGTRRGLIQAMESSGWHMADPHRTKFLMKHALSILSGVAYANAPVSSLFLFGRRQDIAFQIPLEGLASRHHVRFWATTYEDRGRFNVRSIHWHNRKDELRGENLLWVGAASLDSGIAVIRHNLQVTHMIDPDTDQERELIVSNLEANDLVERSRSIKLDKPYRLVNRAWRGHLNSDGKMTVVSLKKS